DAAPAEAETAAAPDDASWLEESAERFGDAELSEADAQADTDPDLSADPDHSPVEDLDADAVRDPNTETETDTLGEIAAADPPSATDLADAYDTEPDPALAEPDPALAEPDPALAEAHLAPASALVEEPHEEAYRRSLAGRVLTWLFFLIAGAALILWAGPRIAPQLPSGLEPVAVWLAPGSESAAENAEARAALRAELLAEIAKIRPGMPPEDVETLVSTEATSLRTDFAAADTAAVTALRERIGTLSDQVEAQDSAEIEARLGAVETVLKGLTAELEALTSDLAGVAENDGQISEEASARIAAFSASVEGLKGELGDVSTKIGTLAQRVDEVEAASRRREQESAERAARVAAEAAERARIAAVRETLAEVGARIEAGTPFEAELAALAENLDQPIPDALAVTAADGVPTLKELLDSFAPAAHAAIRASIRSEPSDGVVDRATAFFEARVATRSLEEQEGDSADAVLSRVEARLRDDRPAEALAEAQALPDEAQGPMAGWLARLALRAGALDGYASLRDAVDANN
ncbi:MAG: hypothetical protein AAGE13_14770, partial [Pseudomonadota bacterium]